MRLIYPSFVKNETKIPSEDWLSDFKGRWNLKTLKSTDIEGVRSLGATVTSIRKWFSEVYDPIDLTKYDKSFIGNMDETMISSKSRMLCVVRRTSRYALNIEDENSEHITLVCTVTANGDSTPPFAIFPLKNMPTVLDDMVKDNQLIVGGIEIFALVQRIHQVGGGKKNHFKQAEYPFSSVFRQSQQSGKCRGTSIAKKCKC